MAPITYKFRNFQELFDRVPLDRIKPCLHELAEVLAAAKATAELVMAIGETNGTPLPAQLLALPEEMEWIDDGKQELGFSVLDKPGGTEIFSLSNKPKPPEPTEPK